MRGLTGYVPKWEPGLPFDHERIWLGESDDGRPWLLRWNPAERVWLAVGYDAGWDKGAHYPQMMGISPKSTFIVRHMALPSTEKEAANDG